MNLSNKFNWISERGGYREFSEDVKCVFQKIIKEHNFTLLREDSDLMWMQNQHIGICIFLDEGYLKCFFTKPNDLGESYSYSNLFKAKGINKEFKLPASRFPDKTRENVNELLEYYFNLISNNFSDLCEGQFLYMDKYEELVKQNPQSL